MKSKSKNKTTSEEVRLEAFAACRRGDLKAVESMLNAGISADLSNGTDSLLSESVFCSQHEIVGLLIERGAKVNRANGGFEPLLVIAAKKQNLRMMQQLIAAGADVNATERSSGVSVLYLAAMWQNTKICVVLIEHGADWMHSQKDKYQSVFTHLLKISGTSIFTSIKSQKNWFKRTTRSGWNVAHLMSFLGLHDGLKDAIEAGVSIDAQETESGLSALHCAFLVDSAECVEYLLGVGASVSLRDFNRDTAVELGIEWGKVSAVVSYLKCLGSSPFDNVTELVSKKFKNQKLANLYLDSPKILEKLEVALQAYSSMKAAEALEDIFTAAISPSEETVQSVPQSRPKRLQI